jgi:hypothetical protein
MTGKKLRYRIMEGIMKRLQKLCLCTAVVVGLSGLMMITPRASAADVVVHIGAEVAPNPPVYNYVYYPDDEVYFVPDTRVYWWRDHGEWRSGPRIPDGIRLGASVNLRVDGRDPWRHHDVIIKQYPHHDRH